MNTFKNRLQNAFPVFSNMLKRDKPIVMSQGADGAVAGDVTVSKIKKHDQLISVIHHTAGALPVDLTDEFTISADGTINNTGGTDTSSDYLVVSWLAWDAS